MNIIACAFCSGERNAFAGLELRIIPEISLRAWRDVAVFIANCFWIFANFFVLGIFTPADVLPTVVNTFTIVLEICDVTTCNLVFTFKLFKDANCSL